MKTPITNIKPYNNKEQRHGYWVIYYLTGDVFFKGNYINNNKVGYWVKYSLSGILYQKTFFIQ